ncbi:hypothetical protein HN803_07580 [candidate division WWE3 bacterium]|nr:hypothetical protein [candidate division WWE3 bacterium]
MYTGSGLPGSYVNIKPLDNKIVCYGYNCECTILAVVKVQGETDSFGAEYSYYCHDCHELCKQADQEFREELDNCDWCKKEAQLSPTRDWEEGMNGPVYYVCNECNSKQDREMMEEYETMCNELDFQSAMEVAQSLEQS